MNRTIGCGEAVRHLWEYLDQGLADHDHRAVEEHLALCVRCCGELEFARELQRRLRGIGPGDMPPEVRHRLDDFIEGLETTGRGGPS